MSADPTSTPADRTRRGPRRLGSPRHARRIAYGRLAPSLHWHPRNRSFVERSHVMPVKHALLALLAERDLTGYELKLRFERVLGEFWQLNSGQVYSTLERLRRAGLVARRRPESAPPSAAAAS